MRKLLLGAAAVLAAIAQMAVQPHAAQAQWGYASSGGSSGSYATSYGSSGGSSGYTYGSYGCSGYVAAYGCSGYGSSGYVGPVRRLARHIRDSVATHIAHKRARWAARRAAYGCSGYYYGSCGSSGYVPTGYSCCGSSGYSVSYGSSGTYGSSGGSVHYGSTGSSSSSYYSAERSTAGPSAMQLVSDASESGELHLTVTVPPQAKIFVNDKLTTSKGRVRHFISRGLKPGKTYRFEVRAELEAADGQQLVQTREITVQGGGEEALEFAFEQDQAPIETVVTLHVPEDAQVVLAGNPTKARGPVRVFRTARLQLGETWDDYEIEVRVGDQVKRQALRLVAGDQLELSFNFEDDTADKIASR